MLEFRGFRPSWPAAAALLTAAAIAALPVAAETESAFTVNTLAEGIHVLRPGTDHPRWVNSLVVERDDGLLVVAAQPSKEAAGRLLETLDSRFSTAVRYLVLPHSHADAAGGASAFPEDVLVIGTRPLRDILADESYDFGAEARLLADDPESWTEPARPRIDLVVTAVTELTDSKNTVVLFPMGHVHSRGDMMVSLAGIDLFYVGAVAFPDRSLYAGDSRLGGWSAALNHLVREGPRHVVPLRGENVDVDELREERDVLAWVSAQAASALAERLEPDKIREQLIENNGTRFDAGSPLFLPLIDEAIRQNQALRRRR